MYLFNHAKYTRGIVNHKTYNFFYHVSLFYKREVGNTNTPFSYHCRCNICGGHWWNFIDNKIQVSDEHHLAIGIYRSQWYSRNHGISKEIKHFKGDKEIDSLCLKLYTLFVPYYHFNRFWTPYWVYIQIKVTTWRLLESVQLYWPITLSISLP